MGALESVAAIASAVVAIISLVERWQKQKAAERAQHRADLEAALAVKIQSARTDDERKAYAEQLQKLRNPGL